MYWTLQNLKDSENKQYILHYGSMFSAATVRELRIQAQSAHSRIQRWGVQRPPSFRSCAVAFAGAIALPLESSMSEDGGENVRRPRHELNVPNMAMATYGAPWR
jgi:hypothetical protein